MFKGLTLLKTFGSTVNLIQCTARFNRPSGRYGEEREGGFIQGMGSKELNKSVLKRRGKSVSDDHTVNDLHVCLCLSLHQHNCSLQKQSFMDAMDALSQNVKAPLKSMNPEFECNGPAFEVEVVNISVHMQRGRGLNWPMIQYRYCVLPTIMYPTNH